MNTTKSNEPKESDQKKAVRSTDLESSEQNNESLNIIPSDTILAEKDEVKNAEERLRLKKDNEVKSRSER